MYDVAFIEVSGVCNGKCVWCTTGRGPTRDGLFMPVERFSRLLHHLLQCNIISDDTVIHLYNWGEPLLHPQIAIIMDVLATCGLRFAISTNASRVLSPHEWASAPYLETIVFSVPGFSQSSYNRMHGFPFQRIVENIKMTLRDLCFSGFNGTAAMVFHLYQHNELELEEAAAFAAAHAVECRAYYAYFNGYELYRQYLTSTMSDNDLKRAKAELFLDYIEDKRTAIPASYRCPQFAKLAVDERCRLLTCCVLERTSRNYAIADMLSLSGDSVSRLKESQNTCKECTTLGIHYLVNAHENRVLIKPPA